MASGVCPPSPRKEDGRAADCNEYRELLAYTRRNPPMDLPEKEDRTGGYPHDDFRPCGCIGTFAGAHAVGHQPVYGAAWRTYSGGDSGRTDGTVQIYAGLFGQGGGDVCRAIDSGRMDTSGQGSAKGTGRRTGGSGRKGESGGETGFAGMRRG